MHIFAGLFKNRTLSSPKGLSTRPTSGRLREAVFNIVQSYIQDADFLDLFAGSGAVGLEALSRGAKSAVFVDHNKECIKCIQNNLEKLEIKKQGKVIYGDVFLVLRKLEKEGKQFDIIYVDPPYELQRKTSEGEIAYSQQILTMIDQSEILKKGGVFFIEEASSFSPESENLKSLTLHNSRQMGRSSLHQYIKEDI